MKIIFLDVDGVIVPASEHLVDFMASFEWRFAIPQLRMVEKICELTGAKVIMNTSHNRRAEELRKTMCMSGFNPAFFCEDLPSTNYPDTKRDKAVESALNEFLAKGIIVEDYVCIDDVVCAPENHMVTCDPYIGLTIYQMNDVIERWGGKPLVFYV